MTIFAMFFCSQWDVHIDCHAYPFSAPPAIYRTLADCKSQAQVMVYGNPPKNGRYHPQGAPNMWYECRSKHVDTWEPAR
jgi:hypothetical protein